MMNRRALSIGILLLVTGAAWAVYPIEAVVLDNDEVAGVGFVTSIANLAINDFGQWYVEVDTDNANSDIDYALVAGAQFGPFGLAYQEGQPLASPPGATLDSFDSVNINNAGNSGWNFFLDGTSGSGDDSGIYFNSTLVIQESTISTAPGFPANTPYIGFFDVKINNMNNLLTMASMDYGATGSVDRALVRIDNPMGAYTEAVVLKEGDEVFPGRFLTDFETGPAHTAFNDAGQAMYIVDLDGDSADDQAIFVDNTLVAREGSPSPVDGVNYRTLTYGLDLNNNGDYAFRARLDADSSQDYAIIKNDEVLIREGDTLPAIAGFVFTTVGSFSGPVDLDDDGNVLWYGDWDDPDTDIDTGLFLNDQLIVQEGVTMVDGVLIDTLTSGEDGFKFSNNGEWIIFEAKLEDGRDGAFVIQVPEPTSLLLLLAVGLFRRR